MTQRWPFKERRACRNPPFLPATPILQSAKGLILPLTSFLMSGKGSRHGGELKCGTHGLSRLGSRCGPRLILCPAPLRPWEGEGGGENREEAVNGGRQMGRKTINETGGSSTTVGGHRCCEKPTARCFDISLLRICSSGGD